MTDTGVPIVPPRATTPRLLDAGGALAIDVACRSCGYNLRGLRPGDRCPECGASIDQSLVADRLQFANPAWLRAVSGGVRQVRWGFIVTSLTALAALAVEAVFPSRSHGAIAAAVLGTTAALAALITCWGVWRATAPNPHELTQPRRSRAIYIARAALIVVALLLTLAVYATSLGPSDAAALLIGATLLGAVVAAAATLRRLSELAERIPAMSLAGWLSRVMVGLVVLACATALIAASVLLPGPPCN